MLYTATIFIIVLFIINNDWLHGSGLTVPAAPLPLNIYRKNSPRSRLQEGRKRTAGSLVGAQSKMPSVWSAEAVSWNVPRNSLLPRRPHGSKPPRVRTVPSDPDPPTAVGRQGKRDPSWGVSLRGAQRRSGACYGCSTPWPGGGFQLHSVTCILWVSWYLSSKLPFTQRVY